MFAAVLAAGKAGTIAKAEVRSAGAEKDKGEASGRASPNANVSAGADANAAVIGERGRQRDGEGEREREGDAEKQEGPEGATGAGRDIELLDPAVRQAAQAGVVGCTAAAAGHEAVMRGRSMEELLPALVRRIAWAGDRHRATVRLELGAGTYAGTTLVVHAEGGRVRVEIGGTEGHDLERLRERLDARLRGHGLDVESVS